MSNIISASRRTDIPALYSKWLISRFDAGFVRVKNPYNPKQVSEISLRVEDVDLIVFWSKNPKPLLKYMDIFKKRGYRFYFLFTLNDYPLDFEPGMVPKRERVDTFRRISDLIGPERVIWRYDPIVVSNVTDCAYHMIAFEKLCNQLKGHTNRVIISLVDYYRKTLRSLALLDPKGYRFVEDGSGRNDVVEMLRKIFNCAKASGIDMLSCAEQDDLSSVGIKPGACIDGELIGKIFGINKKWKKDPGQRKTCRCVISKDIGAFDTCIHGCVYCYANSCIKEVRRRYKNHDSSADSL